MLWHSRYQTPSPGSVMSPFSFSYAVLHYSRLPRWPQCCLSLLCFIQWWQGLYKKYYMLYHVEYYIKSIVHCCIIMGFYYIFMKTAIHLHWIKPIISIFLVFPNSSRKQRGCTSVAHPFLLPSLSEIRSQGYIGCFLGHLIKHYQILIHMTSNESESSIVFVLGQRERKIGLGWG